MLWQHGKYDVMPDGSIQLTPIGLDGRQLVSDPCSKEVAVYTRYNQTEAFSVRRRPVPTIMISLLTVRCSHLRSP